MSEDKDNGKIKEDNIAVDQVPPVSDSQNNSMCTQSNETKIGVAGAEPNHQKTLNNVVNKVKLQERNPNLRETIVAKAAEFMLGESVKNLPMERKINFLRSKGLTDPEIREAIHRSAYIYENITFNRHTNRVFPPRYNASMETSGAVQIPYESQGWFKRLFGPIVFAGTVAYFAIQIYKKYIANWLFGKKKSPLENRLETLELAMQRCLVLLEEKNNTPEVSNESTSHSVEVDYIRSELKTIKSLLLNRHQFPPVPATSSIPEWQLSKNTKQQAELQNKVVTNGTDAQHLSQPSTSNGTDAQHLSQPSTSNGTDAQHLSQPSTSNANISPTYLPGTSNNVLSKPSFGSTKNDKSTLNDMMPNGLIKVADHNSVKFNGVIDQIDQRTMNEEEDKI